MPPIDLQQVQGDAAVPSSHDADPRLTVTPPNRVATVLSDSREHLKHRPAGMDEATTLVYESWAKRQDHMSSISSMDFEDWKWDTQGDHVRCCSGDICWCVCGHRRSEPRTSDHPLYSFPI